jgi:hypothetical protein
MLAGGSTASILGERGSAPLSGSSSLPVVEPCLSIKPDGTSIILSLHLRWCLFRQLGSLHCGWCFGGGGVRG